MSDIIGDILARLVAGDHLDRTTAAEAMRLMMSGEVSGPRVAAFLTALRAKGETADEVAGFVEAMRGASVHVPGDHGDLIDTCGTGGDKSHTFNISTATAFVAAGAGLKVAKHGNRSATSKSGGADVLEALGVKIDLSPEGAAHCLKEAGITFLFAPLYHPAVKHVAPIRRELPFPTVFNLLGPLCNPASPSVQMVGVFRADLQDLVAGALAQLPSPQRALVVHGHGGLDELALSGPSRAIEVRDGRLSEWQIDPVELGLTAAPLAALLGGDAAQNAEIVKGIISGRDPGPRTDVVLLNAAAALYIGNKVESVRAGIQLAQEAISSGAALAKLDALTRYSLSW
jgi:anthranilate phosphoribosyltransferase